LSQQVQEEINIALAQISSSTDLKEW
jgi:hypothetical protein